MSKVTTLLKVDQGSDFIKQWRWSTQDPITSENIPIPMAGWTAKCQIRGRPGTSGYLLVDDVSVTLGDDDGMITLSIPAADTWNWTWEFGFYDIVLTDLEGTITRFAEGKITLKPGVTHA